MFNVIWLSEVLATDLAEICEYTIFLNTLQFGGLFDLKETAEIRFTNVCSNEFIILLVVILTQLFMG